MNQPRLLALTTVLAATVLTSGCGKKKRYSPSCDRSVTLTAPWDGYQLPTSGGRVCSSDASRAELQFLSGDRAGWERKFEEALLAAGFAKDKCSSQSCTFKRDGERAVVQVVQTKRWVTVFVRK